MAADQPGSLQPLDHGNGGPEAWHSASAPDLTSAPGPGVSDSASTLVLGTAGRSRLLAAVAADPASSEAGFPDRPAESGAWAGPSSAANGSLLAQLGRVTDRPQAPPPSEAAPESIPVELPRQFGRYRILEPLGKGAMGAIYLAQDTQLGRRVALKVPHLRGDGAAPDGNSLERFYHEARAAAALDHPNLCPVYDVGQIDGIPYLTMAYIKGRPLSTSIRRDRPIPQRRVASMVRKLAQALEEAHYNGVVHRDLKPSNIMVNDRGDLIIVDFGLVWRIGARSRRLTRVGLVVGTPMYMSPEQASGKVEDIGPGCDIYSLGVILYELLTGRPPFEGPEAIVIGQILFVEPSPPSRYRNDLDPRLEAICLKAIAKGLDRRFATMGELAMALGDYLRSAEGAPRLIDAHPPGDPPDVAAAGPPEVAERLAAETSPQTDPAAEDEPIGPELAIEVPESGTLWKSWRQWTAIVEHFALNKSHVHVNRQSYEKLYRTLVEACRGRAAKAQGPRRDFYRRLTDLVIPWMTPMVLESTDREILFSVLSYCRQFEQELLDPTELPPEPEDGTATRSGWWLALALLVGSFVLALIGSYWAR
jgi:serine/threonine protein kinase